MPYTPTGKWSVEYFQINGCWDSVGESAIVLLVDTGPVKPKVVRAVLIDAGMGTNMITNLVATMSNIKADYSGVGTDCLQFDAIIITHWDKDHYTALVTHGDWGYLQNPIIGVKSDDFSSSQYGLVRSFKYDMTTTPPKPLTRFYCEYWGGAGRLVGKARGRLDAGTGKDIGAAGKVLREDPFKINLAMLPWDKAKLKTILTSGSAADKKKANALKLSATSPYFPSPCLLGYCQPRSMLGMNVFTGDGIGSDYKTITGVSVLLKQNSPWRTLDQAPGLYIVGVQRIFLGPEHDVTDNTNILTATLSPKGSETQTFGGGLGAINNEDLIRKGDKDTNPNSVISLLIWNTGSKTSPKPLISLYTGGDAEWTTEEQLVVWLKTEANMTATCIKAGHHGSKAGTSVDLIKQLKPDHIIFSAGYSHAHPTHELLLYLDAWWRSQTAGPLLLGGRIHSVCHPYWLIKVKYDKNLDAGVDPNDKKSAKPTYFRSQLINTTSYDTSIPSLTDDEDGLKQYQEDLAKAYNDWPSSPATNLLQDIQEKVHDFVSGPTPSVSQAQVDQAWNDWQNSLNAVGATKQKLKPGAIKKAKLSVTAVKVLKEELEEEEAVSLDFARDYWRKDWSQGFQEFRVIAPFFETIWKNWSKIPYSFCPIKGQPSAVSVCNIKARFFMDKNNNYKSTYGYTDTNGHNVTFPAPTTKKPPALLSGHDASSEPNPTALMGKRKSTEEETPHDSINGYILLSNLEETILDVENDEPESDDVEIADLKVVISDQAFQALYKSGVQKSMEQPLHPQVAHGLGSVQLMTVASGASFKYIYPSGTTTDATSIAVSSTCVQLSNFVNSLPDGMLSFSSATMTDATNWAGTFSNADSLRAWWSSMLPTSFTNPIIDASGTASSSGVTSFGLTFSFQAPSGSSTLSYTNQGLEAAFHVSHDALIAVVDGEGQFQNNTGVLLSLVSDQGSASAVLSLRNLFAIANIPVPGWIDVGGGGSGALDRTDFRANLTGINGLWFYPLEQLLTQIRFDWKEVADGNNASIMNSIMSPLSFLQCNFSLSDIIAIRKYTSVSDDFDNTDPSQNGTVEGQITIRTTMSLIVKDDQGGTRSQLDFDSYLTLGDTLIQIVLRWVDSDPMKNPLDTFLAWIEQVMHLDQVFDKSLLNQLPASGGKDSGSGFALRETSLSIDNTSGSWAITAFSMTFEVAMTCGLVASENRIPFGLRFSYTSTEGSPLIDFQGDLWQKVPSESLALQKLDPDSNVITPLLPSISSPTQYYISLPDLFGRKSKQLSTLPSTFPLYITAAQIEVSNQYMTLSGTVSSSTVEQDSATNVLTNIASRKLDTSEVPGVSLTSISAAVKYTFGPPAKFDIGFTATVMLQPRFTLPMMNPAYLWASFTLDESAGDVTWTLEAHGMNFNAGALYTLFPNSDNDAVMNTLEEITIQSFDIRFSYNSAGSGKSFLAGGVILLGPVELDLDFRYDSSLESTANWSFDAKIKLDEGVISTTLGEILGDVSSDLANILPYFITSIALDITTKDFIDLEVIKKSIVGGSQMIFSIVAKVGPFEFSFFQVADNLATSSSVRRLLRFTLNKLPTLSSFPLVDKLEQPFDSMDFVWVDGDLSRADLGAINPIFTKNGVPTIVYKDPRTTSSTDITSLDTDGQAAGDNTPKGDDIVITAGCHFLIVVEQNNTPTAILDYNFDGGQATTDTPPPSPPPQLLLAGADPMAKDPGASTVYTKTFGPLSIGSIKLNYEQAAGKGGPSYLQISLDAKIMLGPVSGLLFGFGLRFPMSSIQNLQIRDITPLITGLGLELNRPPISLAGTLMKTDNGYDGGLSISVKPYNFLGGGYYGHPDGTYESVFAFAEVDGPLVELEFASLSGVIAGFGYHNKMTLPTVDDVTTFPFLQTVTGSDALSILQGFLHAPKPWFTPQTGKDWMTAGLTAKAFHVLTVNAVLVLDLDVDVIFALFAECTATVPADATTDAERFAVVDMGLCAILDYGKGIFQVEGQLTPKSYILSSDCKLRGGFALCYWFEGSGHQGDWVFSVGGYHSAFQVPDWYPKPQRLSISWPLGNVTISGDAYFAVTPKCCMGGGHLHIGYQSGKLSAWFDAFADFLINYSPFSFIANIGVSIGVKYTLDLWFTTKKFEMDFSASLHLYGPPVAGTVSVSWSIISFTIHFGKPPPQPKSLVWGDFMKVVQQYDPKTGISTPTQTITGVDGLIDDPNASPDQATFKASTIPGTPPVVWTVNGATFAFSFTSLLPTSELNYNSYGITDPKMVAIMNPDPKAKTDDIYIKPMHTTTKVRSTCKIEIKDGTDPSAEYKDFGIKAIPKQVPSALWGQYSLSKDPSGGASVSDLLKSGIDSTSNLIMGFQFSVPPPLDNGPIVGFSVTECMSDCYEGTSIQDPQLYSPPDPIMQRAYELWLPSTDPDSLLSFPAEYSPEYWQTAEEAWHNPSQSVPDLISRWCSICGANDGVKFTDKLTNFGTTSAPPASLIDQLPEINYLPPLYTPPHPQYKFEVLSAFWNALDVTAKLQASAGGKTSDEPNTFSYTPVYTALGDPDPFHEKALVITWRVGVSYPEYYDSKDAAMAPVSESRPNSSLVTETKTLVLNYSKGLTFGDPLPDNNGRVILSATYYNQDVKDSVSKWSRSSPYLRIPVGRQLYKNPPDGDAHWSLVVLYMIITQNGPEYHTIAASDGNDLLIPPGVTPMPRLTIHRAMWALEDMTDQLYALVTYEQTIVFNVDKGKYPATWTNDFPHDGPKTWSVIYQYGDEPLELLVATDDGGIDSGLQVIDHSQYPPPDRRIFFSPFPCQIPGRNNILAIIWGHNRDQNGIVHAAPSEIYDVVGSGNFKPSNEAFGFDGGYFVVKTCHAFYRCGIESTIQCAAGQEAVNVNTPPMPSISYYDSPTAPMPGKGLFLQNALLGGCRIQSVKTGGYLTYDSGQNGVPVIRADGTDPTQALIFKADVTTDPSVPPIIEVWAPTTQTIYQLQADSDNNPFLLEGPPVPQLRIQSEYEFVPSSSAILISCLSRDTISASPYVLCTSTDSKFVQLRTRDSLSPAPDPTDHLFRISWIGGDKRTTGPFTVSPPAPSRITSGAITPAINEWSALLSTLIGELPFALGITYFSTAMSPQATTSILQKWWASKTPSVRASLSQTIAAIIVMPLPDPFAATDLFLARASLLWRAFYEQGVLWDVISWLLIFSSSTTVANIASQVDVIKLFGDVSARILKKQTVDPQPTTTAMKEWQTRAWQVFQNRKDAVPLGCDPVASELAALMDNATAKLAAGGGFPVTDVDDVFGLAIELLNGWDTVMQKVDP